MVKFLIFCLLLFGICTGNLPQYNCSYVVVTNIGGVQSDQPFISIDDWLIQFLVRESTLHEVDISKHNTHALAVNTKISYDTVGVEFITVNRRYVITIDKFSERFKIIRSGRYPDSSSGIKVMLTLSNSIDIHDLKDSIVADEHFLIARNHIKNLKGEDSVTAIFYWSKGIKLNSIFSIADSTSNTLSPCGFSLFFPAEKFQIESRVRRISRISLADREKCVRIIAKLSKMVAAN